MIAPPAQADGAMAVLFLDVDGVLCCNQGMVLEDQKMRRLAWICASTGAVVVLSSNWRRIEQLRQHLIVALTQFGVRTIGSTPYLPEPSGSDGWMATGDPATLLRPMEILKWLAGASTPLPV